MTSQQEHVHKQVVRTGTPRYEGSLPTAAKPATLETVITVRHPCSRADFLRGLVLSLLGSHFAGVLALTAAGTGVGSTCAGLVSATAHLTKVQQLKVRSTYDAMQGNTRSGGCQLTSSWLYTEVDGFTTAVGSSSATPPCRFQPGCAGTGGRPGTVLLLVRTRDLGQGQGRLQGANARAFQRLTLSRRVRVRRSLI